MFNAAVSLFLLLGLRQAFDECKGLFLNLFFGRLPHGIFLPLKFRYSETATKFETYLPSYFILVPLLVRNWKTFSKNCGLLRITELQLNGTQNEHLISFTMYIKQKFWYINLFHIVCSYLLCKNSLATKGPLISKCPFGVFKSSKRLN